VNPLLQVFLGTCAALVALGLAFIAEDIVTTWWQGRRDRRQVVGAAEALLRDVAAGRPRDD
jgi:hypothetical protein